MADTAPRKSTSEASKTDAAYLSPFYHEAKNEIVRPDQAVFCSQYFVTRWMPHLGPTATSIVLYLRSLAGGIREGEVALQVNQDDIARAAQCSDRTVRREIAENKMLHLFVRTEDRFERGERGRVRRIESIYYVAMDDPLVEEDKLLLEEILSRKQKARTTKNKVIVSPRVLGQNDRIGSHVLGQNDRIRHEIETAQIQPTKEDNLSEQNPKESNRIRNVSETRFRGNSGTDSGDKSLEEKARQMARKYGGNSATETNATNRTPSRKSVHPTSEAMLDNTTAFEAWRRKNEELARYSAQELSDLPSLGFHIKIWNHARKIDCQRGGATLITDGVFAILRELIERQKETRQPQGKAWTRRTRKWFDTNGYPLLVKGDEPEIEEVRAALANAPFLNDED